MSGPLLRYQQPAMLHVNILLFGDYPELADRCLGSILRTADWSLIYDVRIGLNAISDATRFKVEMFLRSLRCPGYTYEEMAGRNVFKYPLMNRMFHNSHPPLACSKLVWFDDDTVITGDSSFWTKALRASEGHVLTGPVYQLRTGFRPSQHAWIEAQPWFGGKGIRGGTYRPRFCQGGFWIADTAFLTKWHYPFLELRHNGGDSILGELCRQQGHDLKHFTEGVVPNADEYYRPSKAKRRGASTAWPGETWRSWIPEQNEHHNFTVKCEAWEPEKTS